MKKKIITRRGRNIPHLRNTRQVREHLDKFRRDPFRIPVQNAPKELRGSSNRKSHPDGYLDASEIGYYSSVKVPPIDILELLTNEEIMEERKQMITKKYVRFRECDIRVMLKRDRFYIELAKKQAHVKSNRKIYTRFILPWYVNNIRADKLSGHYLAWRDKWIDDLLEFIRLSGADNVLSIRYAVGKYVSGMTVKAKVYNIKRNKFLPTAHVRIFGDNYLEHKNNFYNFLFGIHRDDEFFREGVKRFKNLYARFIFEVGNPMDTPIDELSISLKRRPTKAQVMRQKNHWALFTSWYDRLGIKKYAVQKNRIFAKELDKYIREEYDIDIGIGNYFTPKPGIKSPEVLMPVDIAKEIISMPLGHDDIPDWLNVLMTCKLLGALRDQDLRNIDHSYSFQRADGGITVRRAKTRKGHAPVLTVFFIQEDKRAVLINELDNIKSKIRQADFWRWAFRQYKILRETEVSTYEIQGNNTRPITKPLSELLRGHDLRKSAVPLLRSLGFQDSEIAEIGGWSPNSPVFNAVYNKVDQRQVVSRLKEVLS